jgi:hypothetical protein
MNKVDHSEKALRAVRDARKLRELPEWREGGYCLVCRFWKWPCWNCGGPAASGNAGAFERLFNPASRH